MKSEKLCVVARRGGAKRVVLIVLLVLAVLVVAGLIALPAILSGVVGGVIERAAGERIDGRVAVSRVSLSWTGPQRIGSIVLEDPDGSRVGEIEASVDAGLLGIATGSLDLGTVRLRGGLEVRHEGDGTTNLERAVAARVKEPSVVRPGQASPAPSAAEIRVPKGLAFDIDASDLEVSYVPRGGGAPIGLRTSRGEGRFATGRPFTLNINAKTLDDRQALNVEISADRLTDDEGVLSLGSSTIDVAVEGFLPPDYVDALAGTTTEAARGGGGGVLVSARLEGRDGRLTLADPEKPATIAARVPEAMLEGALRGVEIDRSPRATLSLLALDIPLPESGDFLDADWRRAVVLLNLETEAITGLVTLPGEDAKRLHVRPIRATLQPMDELFDLMCAATIEASLGDVSAGTFGLDLRVAGWLNENGRFKFGRFAPTGEVAGVQVIPGPEFVRGKLVAQDFPSVLLQPLLAQAGVDLDVAGVTGETLALDVRSGVRQGTSELPNEIMVGDEARALPPVGEPYLAGTLLSQKTDVYFDLTLVTGRIRTRNDGIKVDSDAAGDLIRAFVGEEQFRLVGDGRGFIELKDVDIPLVGTTPDLAAARGTYRVIVGELGVELPGRPMVLLDSIDAAVTLTGDGDPTWGIDARGRLNEERFAIVGNGLVPGLRATGGAGETVYGLSPRDARPTGTLRLVDVPSSLAGLVSERAERIVGAATGGSIDGAIESRVAGEGVYVDVALESAGAVTQGGFSVDGERIRFDDTGLIVTLLEPGAVLSALAATGTEAPPLVFEPSGEARLTISGTEVPVRGFDANAPLSGVTAAARLQASDLRGTVRTARGDSPISIGSLDATASLSRSGDARVVIDGEGDVGGSTATAKGDLALRGVHGGDGKIDLASMRPEGSLAARNIPTTFAAALLDPEREPLAREAIGDTVDVEVAAEAGAPGWRVSVDGEHFDLATRLGFASDRLTIGPTSGRASVTPSLLDAALVSFAPGLSPRPRLLRATELSIGGDEFSIPVGEGARVDAGALAGALRVESSSDVVFENIADVGATGRASIGLRSLGMSIAEVEGLGPSMRLSADVFDPQSATEPAGRLEAEVPIGVEGRLGRVTLRDLDTRALDGALAMEGDLSELVGETLDLMVRMDRAADGSVPLVVEVRAPRLDVDAELVRDSDGMRMRRPAEVSWDAQPGLVTRLLFPSKDGEPPALRVDGPFAVDLVVSELSLGPGDAPFRPGVFAVKGDVRVDPITFVEPGGERVGLPEVKGTLRSDEATRTIRFDLDATRGGSEGAPIDGSDGALSIDATVAGFSDSSGAATRDAATLTSTVRGDLPSPLLDALGSMDGLLEALVGPRVQAEIMTRGYSKRLGEGTMSADVRAPYATLGFSGSLVRSEGGVGMALDDDGSATLMRVTNEASERLLGVLFPLLTSFEKSSDDRPAVVTTRGLVLPMDGNTRLLNGRMTIDPGTMTFATKSFVSKILNSTSNNSMGTIGRRLKPFDVDFENGVARYKDVVIPAGEFDIDTYGKINLNKRTLDVYTLIPLYAAHDNLAAIANKVPGVGKATRLPIRVKGSFEDPEISLDPGELLRTIPRNIGEGTGDVLDRTIGEALDQLFGNKKDDDKDDGKKDKKDGSKKEGGGG